MQSRVTLRVLKFLMNNIYLLFHLIDLRDATLLELGAMMLPAKVMKFDDHYFRLGFGKFVVDHLY